MRADPDARPTGRDEVRDAVLAAASRHFAARGTAASLREIADDAGVNLGLIHRHFGNKDDLLRAVLDPHTRTGRALIDDAPSTAAAVRQIFEGSARRDTYVRIVAWLLLEGVPVDAIQTDYPTIESLRARAVDEGLDPHDVLGALALTYGWTVFGPQLLAAFGADEPGRAEVEAHLGALVERMVDDRPATVSRRRRAPRG